MIRSQPLLSDKRKERRKPYSEGYHQAVQLLHNCCTADGFLASTTDSANYRRIWARDGVIISLAALLTGDDELIRGVRATLTTLVEHQGPHGERAAAR